MFQFIAKEELEKNERTQMKQLTLEINERQEEEELQVKRASMILAVVAMCHLCLHFHQHVLICSLLDSCILSSHSGSDPTATAS